MSVKANAASPEAARLEAVRRYDILDSPSDGAFDRVTALASREFNTPISIVSIVDEHRIWFKSHHGLDVGEIPREPGLCSSAVMQSGPWLVEDAAIDPRTLANPLVASDFGLRFYLGIPLQTRDGHALGTLCVIDRAPRTVSAEQIGVLEDLAAIVMDEMELRRAARDVLVSEKRRIDELRNNSALLNDQVVQHLCLAKGFRERGDEENLDKALDSALRQARLLVDAMLPDDLQPGALRIPPMSRKPGG